MKKSTEPIDVWAAASSGSAASARSAAADANGPTTSGGVSPLMGLAACASAMPLHARAYPGSRVVARTRHSTARLVVSAVSWFQK